MSGEFAKKTKLGVRAVNRGSSQRNASNRALVIGGEEGVRGAPGTPGASAAYTLAAGLSTAVAGERRAGRGRPRGLGPPVPWRPPSTRLGAAGTSPSHVPRQHRSLFCSKPCARRWETSDGEGEVGRRPSPPERGRPPLDSCASIRKNKAGTGPRFDGAYANVLLKRGRGGARRETPAPRRPPWDPREPAAPSGSRMSSPLPRHRRMHVSIVNTANVSVTLLGASRWQ